MVITKLSPLDSSQPILCTNIMAPKNDNPLEKLVERRQSRPTRDLSLISSINAVYNGRANSKRVGFLPVEITIDADVDVDNDATRRKAAAARRKRDLRRTSTDVTDFTDVSEMSVPSRRNSQGTVESNFSASLPNLRDTFRRDESYLIGGSFRGGEEDFTASDGALFGEGRKEKQVRRRSDAMVRCQEVLEWVKAKTDKNRRKVHFC
mmetsp:Transcript_23895/g.56558  ORF Transcript_23895/g.56558 Transcript_23895/m.56558 type:complete len:207 (+) Transcript_23895:296-916(+)